MTLDQKKQEVIKKCHHLIDIGNKNYKTDVDLEVPIVFSNSISDKAWARALIISNGSYKLDFSIYAIEEEFDYVMSELVPHEVAHLIAFKLNDRKHGKTWYDICIGLGGSGKQFAPRLIRTLRKKYHYKTDNGSSVYVGKKIHDKIQNSYKVYTLGTGTRKSRFSAKDFVGVQ